MGQKLHVAKKYEIEYSSSFGFNNKVVEFHNLLTALGISYNGESWDDDVEVNREDFGHGLEKLKNYDKLDEEKRTKIDEALSEFDEPVEKIIEIMERLLIVSDQENEYMLLAFF